MAFKLSSHWKAVVYRVKIRLTEEMLGTVPKEPEVYARFIAAKVLEDQKRREKLGLPVMGDGQTPATPAAAQALAEEEVLTVPALEAKGWTGFHCDDAGPFLYDYMPRGFMKEAARTLRQYGTGAHAIKQLQDKITRYVFVTPRRIRLPLLEKNDEDVKHHAEEGGKPNWGLGIKERPLRALTAQGPRVTVTRSDTIPAGTELTFELTVLGVGGLSRGLIETVLEYGQLVGLGQWRSGGQQRGPATRRRVAA